MFRTAINLAILAALPGKEAEKPPVPVPLAKDGTWSGALNIGSDRTFKWTGGSGQIQVKVTRGNIIDDNVTLSPGTQSYTWYGANRNPGAYTITVTDAAGSTLTQLFNMVYAFYVGYRKQGDGTTVPATAAPFGQTGEGVQTLSLTAGAAAFGINFSKYTKGGTVVVSGGTTGCTLTSNNPDVATVSKTNDFTATITPLKAGTVAIRVTTANGDGTGLLTVTVA